MSFDLQQYKHIIEQLKPMVREPEFNQVVNQMAADVPTDKRFLIKMEVRRLAKPCIRSIDLRGRTDEPCRLFQHESIQHYLDESAIEVFEQQVRIFGLYCFGVYEAVLEHVQRAIENSRAIQAKKMGGEKEGEQDSQSKRYTAPVVNLLDYAQRHQERMNFSVALEVFTADNKSILATSIDISTSGIKMKTLSDKTFQANDTVSVHFRGLEAEFALDKRDAVTYLVVDCERQKKEQIVRLKRATDYPNQPFDEFLDKFIHGNKRRYKVNMQNTLDAIVNKSCEQFFTPRMPSLPVFVDQIEDKFVPRFAMTTLVNSDIIDYWNDESGVVKLGYMLNEKRLKQICSSTKEKELIVYAFNHIQNERIYFYSASMDELNAQPNYKKLFFGFGSRKISWRVFKLSAVEIAPDDAYSPLSIPDSISVKIKRQNAPPPARLMAKLKNLKFAVHVCDITSDLGQMSYARYPLDRQSIRLLKAFGHPRNRIPAEIMAIRYKYTENRLESRYLLRSQAELTANDITIKGVTEDISIHGLRIELAGPFHGSIDSKVSLNFPKLQEITTKYDLSALRYRVVNISCENSVLHLRSINGEEGKPGRAFFEELIKQNRSRLKINSEGEETIPGISQALRFINAKNTALTSFVAHKKYGRYFPYACIVPKIPSRLQTLSTYLTSDDSVDLEYLYRDRTSDDAYVDAAFKQVGAETRAVSGELFVMFDPSQKNPKMSIIARWSQQFNHETVRQKFIEEALKRGQFIAIKAVFTSADKPDLELLQLEMNYVSMYALHRAKELEQALWARAGCVHLIDISDEVLVRYDYRSDIIKKNQKPPVAHKIEVEGIKKALLGS